MKEEVEDKKIKGSATSKVKKLQKQYNKILIDLFDQYAAECIEDALEGSNGSFGENIQDIVQGALDNLRGKVLEELGIETSGDSIFAIGNIAPDSDFISGMVEEIEEDEDEESEEHEAEESSEFEEGERAAGDEDEDEDEDKLEEKAPPGKKMERMVKHIKKSAKKSGKSDKEAKQIAYATAWKKYNESDESVKRDQIISESRRNDQTSIMDAYMSIRK
jgi:hypothetical protein